MPLLYLKTFGGLAIQRDGAPAEGAGAQRRRLALLALLAAAGERGMSREKLLGMLWPESDLERARKNLAQAVYALRRDLGAEELVQGTNELRIGSEIMGSDLADFRRAIAEGRVEEAVALYTGPFLEGVYLDEAPEFEHWAEGERTHLAREFAHALESLAESAASRGEYRRASGFWRRLANTDPLNARAALGLMRALAGAGDRAQALQHFRVYEMLLRQELQLAPDAEIRRFAEELRQEKAAPTPPSVTPVPQADAAVVAPVPRAPLADVPVTTMPGTPAVTRPAPTSEPSGRRMVSGFTDEYARPRPIPAHREPTPPPATPSPATRRPPLLKRRSTHWGMVIGALATLLAIAGILKMRVTVTPADATLPVVAVGLIRDYTKTGGELTRPLADMLATDLARARDLQVISTSRMYELLAQGGVITDTAAAVVRAARAAGASQLLDGALYQLPGGRLRLDLRRTSLASGNMIQSYIAEGTDLFALVEEARKGMGRSVDSTAGGSLADVTTKSVLAYRLYEEGLRSLASGDAPAAQRLLRDALKEDSTFAMAAYWLARASGTYNDTALIKGLERAVRLSSRASDRERLTILAGWANSVGDPSAEAIAETLTVRYPNEPEGYLWLSSSRVWGGDFPGAIAPLQRVIALDSIVLKRDVQNGAPPIRCYGCEAFYSLIGAYQMMDSQPAAVRTAREWARIQPKNYLAWGQVSWTLMMAGRLGEALAADQQVSILAPSIQREGFKAQVAFRAGDFATVDAYFTPLQDGPIATEGFKWMNLSLRAQGRPRASLIPGRKLRETERASRRDAAPYNALFEAQSWFDLGEFRHSAALFDSISRSPRDSTPSQVARHRVWTETLRATALAAAGDTIPLSALADSVERWGRGSAYGRDQRLHHHIRGLLYTARGKLMDAAREFRQSIFSPTLGYTRTNLELGKVLLRLDQPREAAYWAESGLRGSYDAANTYVTPTELAELAASAWDVAGERDSAIVRYEQVLRNWKDAEPTFSARVERARLRLAALQSGR